MLCIKTKITALLYKTCHMLRETERWRGERAEVSTPTNMSEERVCGRKMKSGGILRSGPRCEGVNSHFLLTSVCTLAPDPTPPSVLLQARSGQGGGCRGMDVGRPNLELCMDV